MKHTLHIAWKDLLFLLRSPGMMVAFLLFPIVMMLMLSYVFPNQTSQQMEGKIGVVSQDPAFSLMAKSENVIFYKSLEDLARGLMRGDVMVGVLVPQGFTKGFLTGEAKLKVIPNPKNPQMAVLMTQMIPNMMQSPSLSTGRRMDVELSGVDGGEFNYYDFTAPGLMAMIAILSVSTGLAAAITRERELGTLDGIMVAPISRGSIVVGKVLSQVARGLIQALLILGVSILFFNVQMVGSIWNVILLLILGTFSFIGIGVIVTAGMKSQETAQLMISMINFPMMFFSGVFFPVEQMPKFAHYVSKVLPLTYAADALRNVMILGAGLSEIWLDIVVLLGFAVVTSSLATVMFPRLVKD